ncbi:RDD family protein, partial [Rhodococcus erythropolis]|nr:RDD family protein [Rhodococcus erythropolis]
MTTGGQDPNQNPEDGKQFPPQDPYGQQGTPPPGSYPPP